MKIETRTAVPHRVVDVPCDTGRYTPCVEVLGPTDGGAYHVRVTDEAGSDSQLLLTRDTAAALVLLLTTALAEG